MYLNLLNSARSEMNFKLTKAVHFFGSEENNHLTKLFNKKSNS